MKCLSWHKLTVLHDLHHLCGSPSHGLGSRDESLSPARVSGVELLDGGCALNEQEQQYCQSCLLFYWMEQNSLIPETKAVGLKTKTKLPVFGVWLTLPPSTISFCKSVDAMINMRMACRKSWTTTEKQEIKNKTHICTSGCKSETGHVYGGLRRNQTTIPSSGLCSWKGFCRRERWNKMFSDFKDVAFSSADMIHRNENGDKRGWRVIKTEDAFWVSCSKN